MIDWKAEKCPCGHEGCHSWMVVPVAALQGLHITEEEAYIIAVSREMLSVLKKAQAQLNHIVYSDKDLEIEISDVLEKAEPAHLRLDYNLWSIPADQHEKDFDGIFDNFSSEQTEGLQGYMLEKLSDPNRKPNKEIEKLKEYFKVVKKKGHY